MSLFSKHMIPGGVLFLQACSKHMIAKWHMVHYAAMKTLDSTSHEVWSPCHNEFEKLSHLMSSLLTLVIPYWLQWGWETLEIYKSEQSFVHPREDTGIDQTQDKQEFLVFEHKKRDYRYAWEEAFVSKGSWAVALSRCCLTCRGSSVMPQLNTKTLMCVPCV